jgi:hypothetical protein
MVDEVLAGAPLLALVSRRSEAEGAPEQVAIDLPVVGGNLRDELFDQLLVSLACF